MTDDVVLCLTFAWHCWPVAPERFFALQTIALLRVIDAFFCWQMMQHLSPFKVAWEAENRSCIFDMLLMMQKPTDFSCSFRVFNKNTTVAFWLHSHIWNVYTVCERLSKAIKQNKSGQQKLRLPISPLPSPSAVDFPYQRDNQTKQIKTWIILRKNTIWLLKAINFFKFLYQIWGCWMTSYHL